MTVERDAAGSGRDTGAVGERPHEAWCDYDPNARTTDPCNCGAWGGEVGERPDPLRKALEEIAEGTEPDCIGRYDLLRDWVHKTARTALDRSGGAVGEREEHPCPICPEKRPHVHDEDGRIEAWTERWVHLPPEAEEPDAQRLLTACGRVGLELLPLQARAIVREWRRLSVNEGGPVARTEAEPHE